MIVRCCNACDGVEAVGIWRGHTCWRWSFVRQITAYWIQVTMVVKFPCQKGYTSKPGRGILEWIGSHLRGYDGQKAAAFPLARALLCQLASARAR